MLFVCLFWKGVATATDRSETKSVVNCIFVEQNVEVGGLDKSNLEFKKMPFFCTVGFLHLNWHVRQWPGGR